MTFRGTAPSQALLPAGIRPAQRWPMAARPLRAVWRRSDLGRIERWTGPVDVVHGPNYVVPPARAAQRDDDPRPHVPAPPRAVHGRRAPVPGLVAPGPRARGAWVHTVSDFVRDEVVELLGADPDRVVTVPLGVDAAGRGRRRPGPRARGGPSATCSPSAPSSPARTCRRSSRAFDGLAAADPDLAPGDRRPGRLGDRRPRRGARRRRPRRPRACGSGSCREQDAADLLAGAAVVAVPSLYEGFGLVAAEAMARGHPRRGLGRRQPPRGGRRRRAARARRRPRRPGRGARPRARRRRARRRPGSARARPGSAALTWDRTADGPRAPCGGGRPDLTGRRRRLA